MKKISIIIPFYNVEKYIEDCYNSVYFSAKDYLDEVEIILVDDCGSDNSYNIVKKIAKESTIIVKNPKNLMLGGARNAGVKRSNGEWLMFVDSDDQVQLQTIQLLLEEIAKDSKKNVIKYGFSQKYTDKCIELKYNKKDNYMHKPGMSWAKIIKKEIFLEFKEHLKYEDLYWQVEFIVNNKKKINLGIINKPLYVYNKTNENSITSSIPRGSLQWINQRIRKYYKETSDYNVKQELYEIMCEQAIVYLTVKFDRRMAIDIVKNLFAMNPFSIKKNYKFIKKMKNLKFERNIIFNNE